MREKGSGIKRNIDDFVHDDVISISYREKKKKRKKKKERDISLS